MCAGSKPRLVEPLMLLDLFVDVSVIGSKRCDAVVISSARMLAEVS